MAAAKAYPPWVIFEHDCTLEVDGCSSSIADANTLASSRTTGGLPINVSLCLAAPPEGSRVCVQLPAGVKVSYAAVLAAHGDSVVVQVAGIDDESTDHFVYNAGDAAAEPPRPPSLSLLAPHSITYEDKEEKRRPCWCHYLDAESTGLLRRGEDDFLVAELKMEYVTTVAGTTHEEAALHLLRSASDEWCVKRPVVRRYDDGGETVCVNLASWWRNSTVIPVGDRMLCWVHLDGDLLFSDDVFDDESPSLWYVPPPEDADLGTRSVCVTADGSTVKFVNVFPRCCCGGAGRSFCLASFDAYAVRTWTLRMDDMTWAMDARLDATQLWSLDGYKGLPRVELAIPVVSMDEPDAICFEVVHHENHGGDETILWRIMVDMKSKSTLLRSVFRYPKVRWCRSWVRPLPSSISRYFNSKPPSSGGQPAQAEAMLNLTNRGRAVDNKVHAINTVQQAASDSPEAAILAALQAIPGLDRDDLLKAYRILTHDSSGCRFRALMGLPMDFRKDCVLMEIKASEACILCSLCSEDLQLKG
ncbi:hypothetical protein SORBI_3010G206700 [Sorghum bicolor]|jgi:hypothetical protein|uniref:DUF1618 domain-containing protein n=1 Tax=Sorghum bicolor TaxID=4558 RepID=A0A194YKH9_SORBI|nr:hypothetical protein SORBI_3010G206700 [Sorghum bicolor]